MKKNWWIIPIGLILYIGYRKYLLSKSINVFFKGLDLSTLTLTNPTLQLQVQVNNPTSTTADLQNITGDLYIDSVFVGSVVGITPKTINSGASIINIPVTLNYTGIADLISKFSRKGFKLEFKGSMLVDFITIPLEFQYSI